MKIIHRQLHPKSFGRQRTK